MRKFVTFSDRTRGLVRLAEPGDVAAIRTLYDRVYGGKYTLPEATEADAIARKIADPASIWVLCIYKKELVGSVIFSLDREDRLGKVYAAAVLPDLQGRNVMHHMVKETLPLLTDAAAGCDALYATTRTVNFAPQLVLEKLDFVSLGIFPNVRKVATHETHGLSVYLTGRALKLRRRRPTILFEIQQFYKIVQRLFDLEEPEILKDFTIGHEPGPPMRFLVERDEARVRNLWKSYLARRMLRLSFYPFHEPNVRFHCPEARCEVFMNVNPLDGYGAIIGVKSETENMVEVFNGLADPARAIGVEYIELLVSAFDPAVQRQALEARFLPCAYFPAMKRAYAGDERLDTLCFSRSFVNLDFTDLHLVDNNRRFLEAFMGCWYAQMLRFGPTFEDMLDEELY